MFCGDQFGRDVGHFVSARHGLGPGRLQCGKLFGFGAGGLLGHDAFVGHGGGILGRLCQVLLRRRPQRQRLVVAGAGLVLGREGAIGGRARRRLRDGAAFSLVALGLFGRFAPGPDPAGSFLGQPLRFQARRFLVRQQARILALGFFVGQALLGS